MRRARFILSAIAALVGSSLPGATIVSASSHMDAPLISLDDAANTTDVYAFVSRRPSSAARYLTVALSVYPFEEPGIGPNNHRFDPDVTYDIHVALDDNIARGVADITYRFRFQTAFVNRNTILQSYLGVLNPAGAGKFPANQNLRQTYSVTRLKQPFSNNPQATVLGSGLPVPPNNQGRVTRFYNQGNDGDRPARPGAASQAALDLYTQQSIAALARNYRVFAGQRDDGFYADIQSIFDLDFTFGADRATPTKPFDS